MRFHIQKSDEMSSPTNIFLKMSAIHIRNIDSKVTKRQLKSIFKQFGAIKEIEYDESQRKLIRKAKIYFRDENSAAQACEFDEYFIEGHALEVKIMDAKKGDRNPSNVKKNLWTKKEIFSIIIIAVISFLLRVPNLAKPNVVVYEEAATGSWITSYITRTRSFDWDPPLAKMIYAGYARLVGYKGDFDFLNKTLPENQYPDPVYIRLRFLPCICGSLVAPLITAALYIRFFSLSSGFIAGLLLAIDFASIVQSRFILIDPIVHLFVALTIFFSCLLYRKNTFAVACLQSLFAACAFCSKFICGTLFVFVFVTNYRLNAHKRSGGTAVLMRSLFLIWLSLMGLWFSMWAHLSLTPKWGDGDKYTKRSYRRLQYVEQIPLVLYDMYRYRRDDGLDHPYQSRFIDWPTFKAIPNLYWSTESHDQVICAFNNPAAAIGAAFGIIICFLYGKWDWTLGFSATYFIYAYVRGGTWTTSYIIPMMFGLCGLAAALDRMPPSLRLAMKIILVVGGVYALHFWSSWIYGTVQTPLELSERTVWPRLRALWRVK